MVPIAIDTEGSIRVAGLAPRSSHRGDLINLSSVDDLISGGHALRVDNALVDEDIPKDTVALWLGEQFQEPGDLRGMRPSSAVYVPSPVY